MISEVSAENFFCVRKLIKLKSEFCLCFSIVLKMLNASYAIIMTIMAAVSGTKSESYVKVYVFLLIHSKSYLASYIFHKLFLKACLG